MARLAKEVLAEIPDQFLSYMRTRGIKPGPLPPPYTPCPPPAIHPLLARRLLSTRRTSACSLMSHSRKCLTVCGDAD
ncbi:copine-8-like isoform X1 [Lates japonicus]|uniref:Copine-8-like isoform X1 n=1 Tax=Lates japonicus TaxID=270547 RepID=A0AAD3MW75_LATJO|nr:copine-8-like isoform X1 [Lates japonicus]